MPKPGVWECRTCVYFAAETADEPEVGECRRFAPKPGPDEQRAIEWPDVLVTDWCGEWRRQ